MNVPDIDISPEQWEIVQNILRKHAPQCEVWAFGSRAKKSARKYSDLDLVIVSEIPLGIAALAVLSEDFSESDLPWKVDVVDWSSTTENFRRIMASEKVEVQQASAENA